MKKKLESVKQAIKTAAESCGRSPGSIRLVAVSKTMPAEKVKEAIDAGAAIIGENYIQESREKFKALSQYNISWHFIGHLQTNKAKYAVRLFDLIHTVDTLKLARELNKEAEKHNKIQHILIQVNIGKELSKSGTGIDNVLGLAREISMLKNLSLKGLMTIPPFFNSPEKARPFFKKLMEIKNIIKKASIANISMDELSMGMTGDFKVAIEEGATLVRIGTAIFGQRN